MVRCSASSRPPSAVVHAVAGLQRPFLAEDDVDIGADALPHALPEGLGVPLRGAEHVAGRSGLELHRQLRLSVVFPYPHGEEGQHHGVHECGDVADVAGDVVVGAPHLGRHEAVDDEEAEAGHRGGESHHQHAEYPGGEAVHRVEHGFLREGLSDPRASADYLERRAFVPPPLHRPIGAAGQAKTSWGV